MRTEFKFPLSSCLVAGLRGSVNQSPSTMNLYSYSPGGSLILQIHSLPTRAKRNWDWFQLLKEPATATILAFGRPLSLNVTLPCKLGWLRANLRAVMLLSQELSLRATTRPALSRMVEKTKSEYESARRMSGVSRSLRLDACDGLSHSSPRSSVM